MVLSAVYKPVLTGPFFSQYYFILALPSFPLHFSNSLAIFLKIRYLVYSCNRVIRSVLLPLPKRPYPGTNTGVVYPFAHSKKRHTDWSF